MRPLSLRLQGLRSYRDLVEVDLDWLGGAGLFGIVGPTGSGKSAVLDALFLALYGDTPRSGRLDDVLHPEADRALVELELRTSSNQVPVTWRVRREWRRPRARDTGRLRPAVLHRAELRRVSPAPEQLVAAKGPEVDRAIAEEVVGIPMSDFRRAVVLPQGEFDQLLRLPPKDRASLLGRVFGLERFGEPLRARARGELDRLDSTARHLEGQLSAAAVTRAQLEELETTLGEAKKSSRASAEHLVACEQQVRRVEGGVRLAAALAQARAALETVRGEAGDLEEAEQALERATRANRLLPLVEEVERADARTGRARERLEELTVALDEARKQADAAGRAMEAFRASWPEEARTLNERLERARRATELEHRAKELKADARRLTAEQEERQARLARAREALEVARERLAASEKEQTDLDARLAAVAFAGQERDRLTRLVEAWRAHRLAEERRRERDDGLRRARQALQDVESRLDAAREEHRLAEEVLKQAEAEKASLPSSEPLARALAELQERVAASTSALAGLERATARAVEREASWTRAEGRRREAAQRLENTTRTAEDAALALEEARRIHDDASRSLVDAHDLDVAAHLARRLSPDHPCPVCGSAEHPAPARAGVDTTSLEQELAAAKAAVEKAEKASRRALEARLSARAAAEATSEEASERQAELVEARSGVEAASRAFQAVHPGGVGAPEAPHTALVEEQARLTERLEALSVKSRQIERACESARSDVALSTRTLELLSQERLQLAARAQAAEESARTAEARLEEARENVEALRGELELEELEGLGDRLREREDEIARLHAALRTLAGRRQTLSGEMPSLVATVERLAEATRSLTERIGDQESTAGELLQAARALVGEEPAQRIVETLQRALDEGDAKLEALREAQAQADRARAVAGEACAAARREEEEARVALEHASNRLDEGLEAAGLEVDEIRRVAVPEATLAARRRSLEETRGRLRAATARFEEVASEASAFGELPAREALEKARAALGEATAGHERAIANQAQIEARLAHARETFARSEQAREALAALTPGRTRLETLSKLLKGQALVSFAAERHLTRILSTATQHLARLSTERYVLLRDPSGELAVRDAHQGGALRPVSTLSGGESFLVSLAFALALSDQIQARGSVRFDFFFLDEGFGALDEEALGTALDALEKLRGQSRVIGAISHLPAVQERLPRRLVVHRAPPGGTASVTHAG